MILKQEYVLIEIDSMRFTNYHTILFIDDKQYLPMISEIPIIEFSSVLGNIAIIKIFNSQANILNSKNIKIYYYNFEEKISTLIYRGLILSVAKTKNIFELKCVSILRKLLYPIGNFFSQSCRACLGDKQCKVEIDKFQEEGSVSKIISNLRFLGNHKIHTNEYYDSGLIVFGDKKLQIVKEYNGVIEILQMPNFTISPGDCYKIYPGCNKTSNACKNKFNNIVNFHGEPFV